ncbi:MAG: methyltransferase domain-containing protein [Rhodopila sp.]
MTDATPPNAAQIAYWNDIAPATWTAYQVQMDAMFEPLTRIALDAAAPSPGETAIDIGCGCGGTILALADRVGPTGRVLGLDVSHPMAALARERTAAQGLTNAEISIGDAATHAFTPVQADLLFSRFGVMFFDDPPGAFANLRSAMRSTGRMVFACWRPLADNAWFNLPLCATRDLLPPQPPADPTAPGPFAFADPDRVRGILSAAGWRDVDLRRADVPIRPGNLAETVGFSLRVGPLAAILREVNDEALRARVEAALTEALRPHDGPNGVTLQGSIWIVSARP